MGVAGGRSKENSTLVFSLWSEMFNEKHFFATSLEDMSKSTSDSAKSCVFAERFLDI